MRRPRAARPAVDRSAFAGFRFPPEVITVAVRWYLRYGLSYRDVEELLAERGVEVDHVTVYRWVQRFTPLFADAARPLRHATGDRWFVDETYVKVAGRWRYLYRAVDQYGQVIDVLLSEQRDTAAARRFFTRALALRAGAGRGDHRQGRPVPAGARRTRPGRRARHRAVRQQPDRKRSCPVEGAAAADARAETASGRPPGSPPAMPSCRTSAAATTNSPPTPHRRSAWPPHSPSSHRPCDRRFLQTRRLPRQAGRNRPQRRTVDSPHGMD